MRTLIHQAALAATLSVPYSTAGKLMRSQAFPIVTMPDGQARVDPADVSAWIQRQKLEQARQQS